MFENEVTGIKFWKIILIVLIILLAILIIFFIKIPKKVQKKDININYRDQVIDSINFEKIKIYSKNGNYYFTAKVVNKNNYDVKISPVTVTLNDGKLAVFTSYIGEIINANDYKMLTMETKKNLESVKRITFKFET